MAFYPSMLMKNALKLVVGLSLFAYGVYELLMGLLMWHVWTGDWGWLVEPWRMVIVLLEGVLCVVGALGLPFLRRQAAFLGIGTLAASACFWAFCTLPTPTIGDLVGFLVPFGLGLAVFHEFIRRPMVSEA